MAYQKEHQSLSPILCHMLQIDPSNILFDALGKKKKKIQKPIRQLNLISELTRKIDENYKFVDNLKEEDENNEEKLGNSSFLFPKIKEYEIDYVSKKIKSNKNCINFKI